MYRFLLMWLGPAAALRALDLDEMLTAQGEADAKATEEAGCWCKEFLELVSSRMSGAEATTSALERLKTSTGFENERLRQEVAQRHEEVASHSRSLDTMASIAGRATSTHEEDHAELKTSLRSVNRALDALGENAGGQVHEVLHRLKADFSKKLNESQRHRESEVSRFEDLRGGKEEMLRLARKAAADQKSRLAAGGLVVARSSSQIEAYQGQVAADGALDTAAQSLCDSLATQASERQRKRQSALVAASRAKADQAQARYMKAASKVMFFSSNETARLQKGSRLLRATAEDASRTVGDCAAALERAEDTKLRAEEALKEATDSAGKLFALTDKSTAIEADLGKVLQNMFMETHLAESRGSLVHDVKDAVSALGATAQADLKSLPKQFADVRSLGKKSSLADQKLVTQLRSALADASMEVVEAKRCVSL